MSDIKARYAENFDGATYVKLYVSEGCEIGWYVEDFYHRLFTQDKIRGKDLLDVGCGPTVRAAISASAFVPEIYLSDFLEQNRNVVANWLRNDAGAFDFSSQFKHVAALEGIRDYEELEKRARKSIKGILQCDILADNPLHPREHRQFDVVTSSYCLDCYPDDEVYFRAMKNLSNLVRPGGHVAFVSTYKCTTYGTPELKSSIPANAVDEVKVRNAMNEANLEVLEITVQKLDPNIVPNSDNKGFLMALAVKRG